VSGYCDAAMDGHCSKCKQEFTHTLVRDLSPGHQTRDVFASPPKPQIPKDGTRLNCPHCGGVQAYKTHDLTYRGDLNDKLVGKESLVVSDSIHRAEQPANAFAFCHVSTRT